MSEDSLYPVEDYPATKDATSNRLRNPPVRKLVESQIMEYEKEIKARKELLDALDANPGVEDVLDKLRKLHI